jgi:hypothetical protein
MNNDTGKWCEFQKLPWHNTNECHSKQPLVAEVKDKQSNSDSKYDPENIENRKIIDVDPTANVVTTKIQPEEVVDPKKGENLFHSHMLVKGTPFHFIVYKGGKKNLISVEVIKKLGLSTTLRLHPYNIGFLH